jgi:hypothetical protein
MKVDHIINIIDKFKLDTEKHSEWELHGGDIVINAKKWRKIKNQLRNQEEAERTKSL